MRISAICKCTDIRSQIHRVTVTNTKADVSLYVALATEALEALELQTAEALRLRSLSDRLQEAMMLIEEKQAEFVEYE